MKHQQVVPDYVVMLESSVTILALVACGWLLFKLVSACVWFPQYMKNLEIEADKANDHLMQTLLPKESIEEENEEDQPGPSKNPEDEPETVEVSEDSDDSPAEIENPPTEESKKKK